MRRTERGADSGVILIMIHLAPGYVAQVIRLDMNMQSTSCQHHASSRVVEAMPQVLHGASVVGHLPAGTEFENARQGEKNCRRTVLNKACTSSSNALFFAEVALMTCMASSSDRYLFVIGPMLAG